MADETKDSTKRAGRPEDGLWHWVCISDNGVFSWFPAKASHSAAGGWTNEDTWEDLRWRRNRLDSYQAPARGAAMKYCPKCGSEGPFYKDKNAPDGLSYRCQECIKAHVAAYRKANPEKVKASKRASDIKNADHVRATKAADYLANKEKVKARSSAFYHADPVRGRQVRRLYNRTHKETISIQRGDRYQENKEQVNATMAIYKKENPLKIAARNAVHAALNRGDIEVQPCKYCGLPPKKVKGNPKAQAHQRIQAHHYLGYEEIHWLDIEWLCGPCHGLHRRLPEHGPDIYLLEPEDYVVTLAD